MGSKEEESVAAGLEGREDKDSVPAGLEGRVGGTAWWGSKRRMRC